MALAVLLAACAGTDDVGESTTESGATSSTVEDTAEAQPPSSEDSGVTSSTDTAPAGGSGDSESPATTNAPPEGPIAPDFTLALGADGAETFTLSQEVKPVFMVFWAEW
jgi:hypothetical protein